MYIAIVVTPNTSMTQVPSTQPTTQAITTRTPTTQAPTTQAPTTQAPTTQAPTTQAPITKLMSVTVTVPQTEIVTTKLIPEDSQASTESHRATVTLTGKLGTIANFEDSDSSVSLAGQIAGVTVIVVLFLIAVLVFGIIILWRCKKNGYSRKKFRSHIQKLMHKNTSMSRTSTEPLLLSLDNINYSK